ncbi:MAG TPA: hypothetical protein PKD72_12145, partial [Gemmatales bacterium]|nr:hypothetical protein [Gemmatales bacterium]
MMTQAEELQNKTGEFEAAIQKAKSEFARVQTEYQEQLPAWQARLTEAKTILQEKEKLLAPEWLKTYQRLVASEGAEALASLSGKSCSTCNMDVTAQQYSNLSVGKIESCKNCAKILYSIP